MALYSAAWERGVKTTYYLHMKPRHTAEQSTVRVNKTERINATGTASTATSPGVAKAAPSGPARKGFGGLGLKSPASSAASTESLGASAGALDAASADTAEPASPLGSQPGVAIEDDIVASAFLAAEPNEPASQVEGVKGHIDVPADPVDEPFASAPASVMSAVAASALTRAPATAPAMPPASLPDVPAQPSSAEPAPVVAPSGVAQLPITEQHSYSSPDGDTELVDGVACPVDPMERLQCESCQ